MAARRGGHGVRLLVLLSMCVFIDCAASSPRVDPQTGLIRVLFIGDAYFESGFVTPLLIKDPMITLNPVPVEFITLQYASIDVAARVLRVYLPRVKRQLIEGYDVVIMAEVREPFLPPKFQNWITEGVVNHGMGFLMGGGAQSFGGFEDWGHPSWEGSSIAEILPVTCLEGWNLGLCRFVPDEEHEDHPLVRNIPWRNVRFHKRNKVVEKQGGTILGRSDRNPPGSPILAYMEAGKGVSEAFTWNWGGDGAMDFHRWSFAPLIMSNLVYYAARVDIPEDMATLLRVRTQISSYLSMRGYVLSVIDFADRVGANTDEAEKVLYSAETARKAMISLYVHGDYEECLEELDNALDGLQDAATLAIEAKNQAMMWVFVIEWLAVSGTGLFCGAVLWTLMVRRSAYKDVGLTRFDGR